MYVCMFVVMYVCIYYVYVNGIMLEDGDVDRQCGGPSLSHQAEFGGSSRLKLCCLYLEVLRPMPSAEANRSLGTRHMERRSRDSPRLQLMPSIFKPH